MLPKCKIILLRGSEADGVLDADDGAVVSVLQAKDGMRPVRSVGAALQLPTGELELAQQGCRYPLLCALGCSSCLSAWFIGLSIHPFVC